MIFMDSSQKQKTKKKNIKIYLVFLYENIEI